MIMQVDLTNAVWEKSTFSSGGSNCLEVAHIDGVVALRDSKDVGNPNASVLILSAADWAIARKGIQNGELSG